MCVKDVKDYKYSSIYSISHYSLKRALSENVKLDVIKVCSLQISHGGNWHKNYF